MHWDYKDQLRQTDTGRRRHGLLRLRRLRPARAQGVGEMRRASPKSASTSAASRSSASTAASARARHAGARDAARHGRQAAHRPGGDAHADTTGNDQAPRQLIRYQFGNHLGSASLELDEQAQIISYEEYSPYGSTTYQAVRSQTETPKRYRYTGKERDEESGLYYHGARYYAPWLGRWVSCDPKGLTQERKESKHKTSIRKAVGAASQGGFDNVPDKPEKPSGSSGDGYTEPHMTGNEPLPDLYGVRWRQPRTLG